MTTTIMVILLILVFFVALFYYTHREDEELYNSINKKINSEKLNETAKTVLTDTRNRVNELRSQVSESFTEMNMSNLPNLSPSRYGKASNGSGPSEMQNGHYGHADENGEAHAERENVPLAHRVSDALNGWNPLATPDNQLPQQFVQWAENTHFGNRVKRLRESTRAMKSWLTSLESEESEILSKQVNDFASDLNFELSWLLDKELEQHPELKRDLEEIIVLYCLATFKGLLLQDELNTFIMFEAWLEDPTRKEYSELNQKLFTILVEQELVEGVPSDLLLADEAKRSEYAIQAINQVLQADRKRFLAILKDLLLAKETEEAEQAPTNDLIEEKKQPSLA